MLESVQYKLASQIDKQKNVASRLSAQIELTRGDVQRSILTRGAANVRQAHLQKALEQVNDTVLFLQSFHDSVTNMLNNKNNATV